MHWIIVLKQSLSSYLENLSYCHFLSNFEFMWQISHCYLYYYTFLVFRYIRQTENLDILDNYVFRTKSFKIHISINFLNLCSVAGIPSCIRFQNEHKLYQNNCLKLQKIHLKWKKILFQNWNYRKKNLKLVSTH